MQREKVKNYHETSIVVLTYYQHNTKFTLHQTEMRSVRVAV